MIQAGSNHPMGPVSTEVLGNTKLSDEAERLMTLYVKDEEKIKEMRVRFHQQKLAENDEELKRQLFEWDQNIAVKGFEIPETEELTEEGKQVELSEKQLENVKRYNLDPNSVRNQIGREVTETKQVSKAKAARVNGEYVDIHEYDSVKFDEAISQEAKQSNSKWVWSNVQQKYIPKDNKGKN